MLSDTSKILKVKYESTGTEMGGLLTLNITQDSITYFYSGTYDERNRLLKNSRSVSIKTDSNYWRQLISAINLEDFDKSLHGESQSPTDGIDQVIHIQTSKKIHSIVLDIHAGKNGYKKITALLKLVLFQLRKFMKGYDIFYL